MARDGRGTEQVRREISVEREQLAGAVSDLRGDLRSAARKVPVVAGGVLAAGVAVRAVVAAVKRRRGDD
ncbi:MAG TPA: hypothetical protein VFN99_07190 [Gaiella sp.]|nr:hypothetical protein [Gaiella sp.]